MNQYPHLTVATIVQRNNEFLMVEEIDNGRRVINQPAGHVEVGESLFDAAIRETREETGWSVRLEAFVGLYHYYSSHNDTTYVRLAFTASPLEQLEVAIDPDISAVHWLDLASIEAATLRSPMVLDCIRDAGKSVPLSLIRHL